MVSNRITAPFPINPKQSVCSTVPSLELHRAGIVRSPVEIEPLPVSHPCVLTRGLFLSLHLMLSEMNFFKHYLDSQKAIPDYTPDSLDKCFFSSRHYIQDLEAER